MIRRKSSAIVLATVQGVSLVITGCQEPVSITQSGETYENSDNGGHAIEADGIDATYSKVSVSKTGDSEGDEADF